VHPATRILLFVCSALALPGLNLFWLMVLMGLLVLAAIPNRLAAAWHLLRRSRWLFLLILFGYAYTLPGEAAWPGLGDYSPSGPGLQAGGLQAARLALLLLLLDRLVLSLGEDRLLAGLYRVFAGLAPLGIDAERLTVRLALTLRTMAVNSRSERVDIRALLRTDLDAGDAPACLRLQCQPWRSVDRLALGMAFVLVLLVWLRA
jgi:hypothetical protein